ncbi:MAG TPA: dihydroorotase, partial [Cryomorphaceae bacterium]|nr:dihydroorotase [Cryomorphaceae bacterium]
DDTIKEIGNKLDIDDAEVFEADNLHVSPGWFDLRAHFWDPGHEEKEDIESGINAAIFGGFTGVAVSPDTNPPIDSKADVEYVYKKAEEFPVGVYPYGAITKGQKGEELSEMYDMYQAGAVGFSQGKSPLANSALLKLALQYHRSFSPPLHLMPLDHDLAKGGQIHEGEKSIYLGLKGIPALAEEVSVQRDLHLAQYAETGVHFMGISAESTLGILSQARKEGKDFTADVAVGNLYFTDEDLESYDTRLKAMPPFRSKKDNEALIQALNDDLISAIASDHLPQDIENKKCEFDHAAFGIIALESFIGAIGKSLEGKVSWERIIELISINPRRILNLEIPSIEEGNWAELTFFNPALEWTFEKKHIQSKSANSPFIGKPLKGKSLGIFNKGTMVWLADM